MSFWQLYDVLFNLSGLGEGHTADLFFSLSGIPSGTPLTGLRARDRSERPWMLTLCTDNGRIRGEKRLAACESGAAAGQETRVTRLQLSHR